MPPTQQQKLLAELWMRQTDIFLKLVSLIPVVELGIAAGWYNLMKDHMWDFALATAVIGILVMIAAWMYLFRSTVYIEKFLESVEKITTISPSYWSDLVDSSFILRRVCPMAKFGGQWKITGRKAGLFVPELCALVNVVLAISAFTCMVLSLIST